MRWTKPTFDEIKMDAEIGSYQEDREDPEPAWVSVGRPVYPSLPRARLPLLGATVSRAAAVESRVGGRST